MAAGAPPIRMNVHSYPEHRLNGWRSRRAQAIRHREALAVLDPQPGESLLDWGCGTGVLSDLLPLGVHYIGADQSPEVLATASELRPGLMFDRAIEEPEPEAHAFDLVAVIGTYNLGPAEVALRDFRSLWSYTRRAMALSVLRRVQRDGGPEHLTFSPEELATLGDSLASSGRWELRSGYLPNDLLLVVRR
jgi:SAM-dependent methyltransferase